MFEFELITTQLNHPGVSIRALCKPDCTPSMMEEYDPYFCSPSLTCNPEYFCRPVHS